MSKYCMYINKYDNYFSLLHNVPPSYFSDVRVNYVMFSVLTVLAVLGVLVFFLLVPVKRSVGYALLYVCYTLLVELNVVLPSVNLYICVCSV